MMCTGSVGNGITFTPDFGGSVSKKLSSSGDRTLVVYGELVLLNPGSGSQTPSYIISVVYEV